MALSMQEKQHVGKEVALRYLRARKKEKGVMLQEFCATTGYSPPYAAFLLRTYAKRVILGQVTLVPTRPSPWPRQRKHLYGLAVVEGLIWMYHLAGEPCGKRLEAAMPELLHAMARHGTVVLDPLSSALLQMGSATVDRLLREEKTRGENRRHAPRTKTREPAETHPHRLLPGALGCCSGTGRGGPREPRWREGSRRSLLHPHGHRSLFGMDRDRPRLQSCTGVCLRSPHRGPHAPAVPGPGSALGQRERVHQR